MRKKRGWIIHLYSSSKYFQFIFIPFITSNFARIKINLNIHNHTTNFVKFPLNFFKLLFFHKIPILYFFFFTLLKVNNTVFFLIDIF